MHIPWSVVIFLFRQTVYRARFSSITESAILKAFGSLVQPDWNESRSVDARMELDLRIGCAFTRFQTMTFQVYHTLSTLPLLLHCFFALRLSMLISIVASSPTGLARHLLWGFVSSDTMRSCSSSLRNTGDWMLRWPTRTFEEAPER